MSDGLRSTQHHERSSTHDVVVVGPGGEGCGQDSSSEYLWDQASLIPTLCCSRASVGQDGPFSQLMVPTMWSVISSNVYANVTRNFDTAANLTFNLKLYSRIHERRVVSTENTLYILHLLHTLHFINMNTLYVLLTHVIINMEHAVHIYILHTLFHQYMTLI